MQLINRVALIIQYYLFELNLIFVSRGRNCYPEAFKYLLLQSFHGSPEAKLKLVSSRDTVKWKTNYGGIPWNLKHPRMNIVLGQGKLPLGTFGEFKHASYQTLGRWLLICWACSWISLIASYLHVANSEGPGWMRRQTCSNSSLMDIFKSIS